MRIPEVIDSITLRDTLPDVFVNEQIPESGIWRKEVSFRRGGRYLIEAASGTGKSSLCSYIFGARSDYQGRILFNGEIDAATLGIDDWQELRRRHIAYLPQELALFPELTAMQNIMIKNSLTSEISSSVIEEWMRRLGIDARADYPVGRMSIGQQQRVAVIRALCQPFDFIILDEPVSHLDAANNRIAAEIIGEEASRRGAAVIATSVGNPISIPALETLLL